METNKNKEEANVSKPDEGVLKRFMQEFFPFYDLVKVGFFSKEMKGDYKAQAQRVCDMFGYKSVYEYGANEIRCHISYSDEVTKKENDFLTVIPSIYDS